MVHPGQTVRTWRSRPPSEFVVRHRARSPALDRSRALGADRARTRRRRRPGGPATSVTSIIERVHRHVADDGDAHAANEGLGAVRQRSRPAVAVAERQGGDPARPAGPPGRAVGHAVPTGRSATPDGPGVQRQHRPEPVRAAGMDGRPRRGPAAGDVGGAVRTAVRDQPGPDAVVARRRAEQDRRRSRRRGGAERRCPAARSAASGGLEAAGPARS